MTTQNHVTPIRILILGAGFGGLATALELCKKQGKTPQTPIDIVIIDRNDFQLFTPDLYEIASAAKSITNTQQLKDAVCLSLPIAIAQNRIRFVQANIESVDSSQRTVVTNTETLSYDYLVLALGSEPFYFNIPGLQEHSVSLKWIENALHIRETVQQLTQNKAHVKILVGGAGPAGVELCAELANAHKKSSQKGTLEITLVEGKECVLQMMNTKAQEYATKRLQKLGVTIRTNFFVASAQHGKVISKEGEQLEADLIIWTGGVKASSLLEKTDIAKTQRGQIAVEKTLQSKTNERIFALGDIAECQIDEKMFCPQTAHEAVHQGPVLADNLIRHINGQPLRPYISRNEGMVVTLGGKNGLLQLPNGMVLHGPIGWFARKYIDFSHFRSVLPFMEACSVWLRGLRTGIKND